MKIRPVLAVCVALALCCMGCPSVAHVELADGTLVSFIQPTRGEERLPDETDAEGRTIQVTRVTCEATRQVGLAGDITERVCSYRDATGALHGSTANTFRLTNVSDKPIALKRFRTYGHLTAVRKGQDEQLNPKKPNWEAPAVCDPKRGFSGIVIDNTRYDVVRAKEPGFNYRLIQMVQPWHLEGDLLVQPLPTMRASPEQDVDLYPIQTALAAPGAEAFLRPLGGGKPFASQPIKPRHEGDPLTFLRFSEGVPTMMPLELCFKAAPDVPATGHLLFVHAIDSRTPIYALEGVKDLNCTLAPGESLTFTLLISSVETPEKK